MTYQIHLETGDGDNRRGATPKRFAQDTGSLYLLEFFVLSALVFH